MHNNTTNNPTLRTTIALLAPFALVIFATASCTPQAIRKHTYPPDYTYLEKGDVHESMQSITLTSLALNQEFKDTNEEAVSQERVVALLQELQSGLHGLKTPAHTANHPLFNENLERFRRDVELALMNAQKDPPNYYYAGSVSGSCLYCHKSN